MKTCCVTVHTARTIDVEKLLEDELLPFIDAGFHRFVTYYDSILNRVLIDVLDKIKKNRSIDLFIELIVVNFHKIEMATKKEKQVYTSLQNKSDETTIISNKYEKQNVNLLCNHLTDKSDFLLCIEDCFKGRDGNISAAIVKAFTEIGLPFKVIGGEEIYRIPQNSDTFFKQLARYY